VQQGLYDPRFEHDSCGVGFVARVSGAPSRELLNMGLEALSRLAHRGAVAADGRSGDGAGVTTALPIRLLEHFLCQVGVQIDSNALLAIGMLFVDVDELASSAATLDLALQSESLTLLCWREVPVNLEVLGQTALTSMPVIRQAIIAAPKSLNPDEFESRLHRARKLFERANLNTYIASLSSRTIVYKALCAGSQLREFYVDLQDPNFESAFVLFHQRYATNTHSSWWLAQPFRLLAHNGEINTISANRSWMKARENELPQHLLPLLREGGSDSCHLDETAEALLRSGRDLLHSLTMLLVPAWQEHPAFQHLASFYRERASMMEPWDGPAAVAFADGRYVGAALDRNGLRPLRYNITSDGLVTAGSEVGLFDVDDDRVELKGRLGPGQMLAVDLERHEILDAENLKRHLFATAPEQRSRVVSVEAAPANLVEAPTAQVHALFGYGREDLKLVVAPMARDGKEAVWSMGDDTPISALARVPRSVYSYFRQRFAQVTNPPIDPLREDLMMSLRSVLGRRPSLCPMDLEGTVTQLELASPIIGEWDLRGIRSQSLVKVAEIECVFAESEPLEQTLRDICQLAEGAVRSGAELLVLSDQSASPTGLPIPMAIAVGAVHHHLIGAGLRTRCDIIVDSGDCCDVHHAAVLIGYGAGAVCPWLALRTCDSPVKLLEALANGLKKVMSKLGISDVASYRGGQFFQTIGFDDQIVQLCFAGTPNLPGHIGFRTIQQELVRRAQSSIGSKDSELLQDYGSIRYRKADHTDQHGWAPPVVRAMQSAVGVARIKSEAAGSKSAWDDFGRQAETVTPHNLRDLLQLIPAVTPTPREEVEQASEIVKRFVSSAMSLGSISPEAHRTLSEAMNLLGGKSNTGEGGEDPEIYQSRMEANNKVKQVASGRFGVTTEYLVNAEELEIKIAQGSKPGEGGQLPAAKVTELIARLRHAQTGMSLISPPPHHDIYSIEDLAQLIHDLKQVNPVARIGVKLVSEAGIGTVASGVVKAYADYIVISGHAGGTGASPLSSIKHAGAPWELGLAETQQTLMRNGLRSRVRLRVDGGLRTARDVVVAALLGAEEFAFGTAALVSLGCDMARQCHLDTCPAGIATQRPELRAKFRGKPEHVVAYFMRLAEDVRGLLSQLGLRSLEEATGRTVLLRQLSSDGVVDLSQLLFKSEGDAPRCTSARNSRPCDDEAFGAKLTNEIVALARQGQSFDREFLIRNQDRSAGAAIAGGLVRQLGTGGLKNSEVRLGFHGAAGQSFGAFCVDGMELTLEGEANDYVGKGLCGGALILKPRGKAVGASNENVLLGNVALYGATSGRLFAAGRAGERFAVRNSGAVAVVEGVGDHGCEYMTGGCIVVLGEIGCNFAAGMTGGKAYVFDPTNLTDTRVNRDSIELGLPSPEQLRQVEMLVRVHALLTESSWAQQLLTAWQECSRFFRVITPRNAAKPVWVAQPGTVLQIPEMAPPTFPQA
jgi:glutamate synthase domain-containing protein 2/glutamate synthase domain-containing protein 1/glutamate synthase domain-containing protein 3